MTYANGIATYTKNNPFKGAHTFWYNIYSIIISWKRKIRTQPALTIIYNASDDPNPALIKPLFKL